MKKHLLIALLFVAGIVLAGSLRNGFGKNLTATTSAATQKIGTRDNDYGSKISVHNTGSNTLYIAYNISTDDFVATNSVPVGGGSAYTFKDGPQYKSICFATLVDTTTFNLAAE